MRTISIRLPDSLHRQLRALAARDGVSVNQLVVLALAEKVHAVRTDEDAPVRSEPSPVDIGERFPGILRPDGSPLDDVPGA